MKWQYDDIMAWHQWHQTAVDSQSTGLGDALDANDTCSQYVVGRQQQQHAADTATELHTVNTCRPGWSGSPGGKRALSHLLDIGGFWLGQRRRLSDTVTTLVFINDSDPDSLQSTGFFQPCCQWTGWSELILAPVSSSCYTGSCSTD